jgi:hypothetical protein
MVGAFTAWQVAVNDNYHFSAIFTLLSIAMGITFTIIGIYWHYTHPILLFCPECEGTIPTFDPWQCSFCGEETTTTIRYSFLHKCSKRYCQKPPPAIQCPSCGESVALTRKGNVHHVAKKWEPEVTEAEIQTRHEAFKQERIRVEEKRYFQKADMAHEHWKDTVKEKQNIEKIHLKASLTEEQIRLTEVQQYAEKLQSSSEPNSKIEALENDLEREIGQFHDAKKVGRKKIQEIEKSELSDREKERMIRKIKDWTLKHGYEME